MMPGTFYPPASLLEALKSYDPACGTGGILLSNPPFAMNTHQATVTVWRASMYELEIKPVAASKLTERTITLADDIYGRKRINRIGPFDSYFNTWEEAHAYLLEKAEERVTSARRQLEQANGYLGNVKGMKKPEGVA
mgnify:CR=1 FL=1